MDTDTRHGRLPGNKAGVAGCQVNLPRLEIPGLAVTGILQADASSPDNIPGFRRMSSEVLVYQQLTVDRLPRLGYAWVSWRSHKGHRTCSN
jgi:hypothetical protein